METGLYTRCLTPEVPLVVAIPVPVAPPTPEPGPSTLSPAPSPVVKHDAPAAKPHLKGIIDDLVLGAQNILEGAQKIAHEIAHGVDVAAHDAITGLHQAVHQADKYIHDNLANVAINQPGPGPVHTPVSTPVVQQDAPLPVEAQAFPAVSAPASPSTH